jgi:hypothetical protein
MAGEYVNIEHWWDGAGWVAAEVLGVKNGRLSVYPP